MIRGIFIFLGSFLGLFLMGLLGGLFGGLFLNTNLLQAELSFADTVNLYGSANYDTKSQFYQENRIDNRLITSYVIEPTYNTTGFKIESHLLSSYSRNKGNGISMGNGVPINLVITDDRTNLFNLTRTDTLFDGLNTKYTDTLINRIDRLYFSFYNDNYELSVGRNIVTWSRGRLFHVSDFFNPQTPAFYDSSYKIGTDLVYLNYSLDSNSNVSLVANPKRNYDTTDVTWKDSTFALRYVKSNLHNDYSVGVAQYLRDYAFSAGSSLDFLYSSILRVDTSFWLPEHNRDKIYPTVMIGLEKSDYYFDYATTIYLEYYHNGLGRNSTAEDVNASMLKRLQNKDTYLLGKNYFSLGAMVELTPYLNFNYSNIIALKDYSLFSLASFSYSYTQEIDLGISYTQSLGKKGDEFGKSCVQNQCYGMMSSIMLSATYNFK